MAARWSWRTDRWRVRRWLTAVVLTSSLLGQGPAPGAGGPPRAADAGPLPDPVALPATAPPPPQTTGPVVLIAPTRVLDTRACCGGPIGFDGTTGAQIPAAALPANTTRRFLVNGRTFAQGTGTFTFPFSYGVLANVTVVSSSGVGGGFVTAFPGYVGDADRPNASTVNPSTPIAHDMAVVAIQPAGAPPSAGTVAIYTTNTVDVVVDVYGYFTAPVPSGWSLAGNAGTDPSTNFIGTTDAQPLVVRTNNAEAMRVAPNGHIGIGTTDLATSRLTLDAGADSSLSSGIAATVAGDEVTGIRGRSAGSLGVGVSGYAGGPNGEGVSGYAVSGTGVGGSSQTGRAFYADGHAGQDRNSGGWVKGMVVMEGGALVKCFNGQATTKAEANSCNGFGLASAGAGIWSVGFPFMVSDRFVSVTAKSADAGPPRCCMVQYDFVSTQGVRVRTWDENGNAISRAFSLIVY